MGMSNVLGGGFVEWGQRGKKCGDRNISLTPKYVSACLFSGAVESGQAKAILHCCCASMSNDKQQLVKIYRFFTPTYVMHPHIHTHMPAPHINTYGTMPPLLSAGKWLRQKGHAEAKLIYTLTKHTHIHTDA